MIRIGSIVRETMSGTVGIVTGSHHSGWIVCFNGYDGGFHMEPQLLEEIEF